MAPVQVLDVGMAKIQEVAKPHHMSIMGGTPSYFCRARRTGKEFDDYDDVWAATCLLAELSAGDAIRGQPDEFGHDGVDFSMPFKDEERHAFVMRCGEAESRQIQLLRAVLLHPDADGEHMRAAQMRDLAHALATRGAT